MEEEEELEYDSVLPQHQVLYSLIESKYRQGKDQCGNTFFFIGETNMHTTINVGYNFVDKHFMLISEFNNEVMFICSFTQAKQFNTIVNLLIPV